MQALADIFGLDFNTGPALMAGGLILARVFTIINLVPFLFGNPVPNMIKLGTSFIFLVLLFPFIYPTIPEHAFDNFLFNIALLLKEVFYGTAIGLMSSLVFYGFDSAGQIIDNQRGASMAQIFSPQTGRQITIFGSFTFQLGIILFLTLGGHHLFIHAMVQSYHFLPIYEMPTVGLDMAAMINLFIRVSGTVLFIAAQLAAPVIISIFVVDLILGVMNRISPAINVLNLGFAIRGMMGVLIFFVALGSVAFQMKLVSMDSIDNIVKMIRYLSA